MKFKLSIVTLLVVGLVMMFSSAAFADIVYVDKDVDKEADEYVEDGEDGKSWATAFDTISEAIVDAGTEANDIIRIKPAETAYAEDIAIAAIALTIEGSDPAELVVVTGLTAAPGDLMLDIDHNTTVRNIHFTDTGETKTATVMAEVVAAAVAKFYNCTFTLVGDADAGGSDIVTVINFLGATDGSVIERCTFVLDDPDEGDALVSGTGIIFNTGAIENVNISGNSFTGVTSAKDADYSEGVVLLSKQAALPNGLYFTGNTVDKAGIQFNLKFDDASTTIENVEISSNIFTDCDAILVQSTNADAYSASDGENIQFPKAAGTFNVKGNHFGSSATDGNMRFAFQLKGISGNEVNTGGAALTINYNHLQYPQKDASDDPVNAGHLSIKDAAVAFTADDEIEAQYNWWGSAYIAPAAIYAAGNIAVCNPAYNSDNPLSEHVAPELERDGVATYDTDLNGQLDRIGVTLDYFVDPATLDAGDFRVAGFVVTGAALNLDNDMSGAPDGLFAISLILEEEEEMDTGVTPNVSYSAGDATGITGSAAGAVVSFTEDAEDVIDLAAPYITSVTTGDDDKNGTIDMLVITFSEDMDPMVFGEWNEIITLGLCPTTAGDYVNQESDSDYETEDSVTIILEELLDEDEVRVYDTVATPKLTIAAGLLKDANRNALVGITIDFLDQETIYEDGAAPIAYAAVTLDNEGAKQDGFIDGIAIIFSEDVFLDDAKASKQLNDFLDDLEIETVENEIEADPADVVKEEADVVTIVSNVITIQGKSKKDASMALPHRWDTDATPLLTYENDADGVEDLAENTWVYFTGGLDTLRATDAVTPIITQAYGEVGTTNLHIAFSEPVYTDDEEEEERDIVAEDDLLYDDVNNDDASAFADEDAEVDGDGSDGFIVIAMDVAFSADDVDKKVGKGDAIAAMSDEIEDAAGNPCVDVPVEITAYDLVLPELISAETVDADADGWVDHIRITFSEDINDEVLEGYNDSKLLSSNASLYWSVEGYTVVALNFVSGVGKKSDQLAATADADLPANAALDANGNVINVGDTDNDEVLFLMVEEGSGPDAVDGDTDMESLLSILGEADSTAAVKDLSVNLMKTVADSTIYDDSGPAIVRAEMMSETSMKVWFSEEITRDDDDLDRYVQTADLEHFSWLIGTAEQDFSNSIRDIDSLDVNLLEFTVTDDYSITKGISSKIAMLRLWDEEEDEFLPMIKDVAEEIKVKDIEDWDWFDLEGDFFFRDENNNLQSSTQETADSGIASYITVAAYVEVDVASPVAIAATTVDDNMDGMIDGVEITFNETPVIAAADTALALAAVTMETVTNAIDLSAATITASGDALKFVGVSLGTASDSGEIPMAMIAAGSGIKDAAGNVVAADDAVVTVDRAAPVLTSVVDLTETTIELTFSENVTDEGGAALAAGDLEYINLADTTGTIAIASIAATAETAVWIATTDSTLAAANITDDKIAVVAGKIMDIALNAAIVDSVAFYEAPAPVIDIISPTLVSAETMDANLDGNIDNIRLTFSENLKDSSIDGYKAPVDTTVAWSTETGDLWTVSGDYTVLGVNFTQDDDDAAVATSEQISALRTNPMRPVANVGDVADDNILYLAIRGVDDLDNDASPNISMVGDDLATGAGVSDTSDNVAASISETQATDGAGPVIMSAEMTTSTFMTITMSEEINDNYETYPLAADVFTWKVGSQKMEWIGNVINFKEPVDGTMTLEVVEAFAIPPGMASTLAFAAPGVLQDDVSAATNAGGPDDTVFVTPPTGVEPEVAEDALPDAYALSKNYPNPFNPTTTIQYAIPADGAGHVELVIYNINAQKVRTLVNGTADAGYYSVVWDGRNDVGEAVSSGIYLYRIVSGSFVKIEKMTFMK